MVAFIRKRLQVFVSSTFSDLIAERQAAVEAILTAGHIPAGMELFTSGDESQMAVIKQWIDESDVFLLILGGRYGSVEPTTSKSYTQLEYEYALKKNKVLFTLVIDEDALEARVKEHGSNVLETDNSKKLREFRTLVLTKLVRFWEDSKDIKIAIGETLSQLSRRDDLSGWVRADQEANTPALADEIARLSKENSQLRTQLTQSSVPETFNGLSYDELLRLLKDKQLLSYFLENRFKFGGLFNFKDEVSPNPFVDKLCVLGLFEFKQLDHHHHGIHQYILSEAGRSFLNRYDVNLLAHD